METTYDKFINANPARKAKFEKEYAEFCAAESILEQKELAKMERKKLSANRHARKQSATPTAMPKMAFSGA